MGETAEFEKLNTLEARLAAALDRIAQGLGAATADVAMADPGFTSAALDEALIRAQTAQTRVAELEAQLAKVTATADAAGSASEMADLRAERDRLAAALAENQAAHRQERDAAAQSLAAQTADIARLQAALTEAKAQETVTATASAGSAAAHSAERELAAAHARADELEAQNRSLRSEIKALQALNERMIDSLAALRAAQPASDDGVNPTILAELEALRGLRASEAAELDRILADLDRAAAGES